MDEAQLTVELEHDVGVEHLGDERSRVEGLWIPTLKEAR